MINKNLHRKKIEKIANLPTLPEVASTLLQIINDPTTSASDAANLISRDLSLTSKVLRLANSAFYGIPRTITTVQNAVVILGLKVINTLVLSITVFEMFPSDRRNQYFDRKKFWQHSLACAVIAKQLALRMRRFNLFDPEECFCAGLLHDIGKVVMDQYLREEFDASLQMARTKSMPLYQCEAEIIGADHCEVGDWLTSRWDLPQDIQLPIVHHHAPQNAPAAREITILVHLSDVICYELGYTVPGLDAKPELNSALVAQLGFSAEEIESVKSIIHDEVEKLQVAFNFS